MNGNPLPPKKEVALALLERGSVHVHLDPRAGGVVVPAWFKRQPQLVLQVGLNMPVPIPDLRVDEDGMSCTLSFNRSPFFCIVPWSSVYAMVGDDGRGMVWPEDVPPEVALQARAREAEPSAKKVSPSGSPSARPPLSVVKSPAPAAPRKTAAKATAKPRAARVEGSTTSDKAKKSRAKKPRAEGSPTVVRAPSPKAKESPKGKGVLVAIPSKSPPEAKAERASREPAPAAPATSTARREKVSPVAAAPEPTAASKPATTNPMLGGSSGSSGSSGARPSPSGKPGAGKAKREIPPYLRVVK